MEDGGKSGDFMKKLLLFTAFMFTAYLGAEDVKQLIASGQGKTTVKATIADINVGIDVQGRTALDVQQSLADKLKPVLSKLRDLKADKLETGTMNIYPEYNYPKEKQPVLTGYRGHIDISFNTEAAKAGTFIDEAIKAGANQMQGYTVKPTDETIKEARLNSLKLACMNALSEANAVIGFLGLENKGILQVSIDQTHTPTPIFRNYKMAMATPEAAPSTEITEQEQDITASVTLHIQINDGSR